MNAITYRNYYRPSIEEFRSILKRSSLVERRPVENDHALEEMLDKANLITTAWDNSRLIGISRSITDFVFCCYLSDLAVDKDYQKRGIGRRLVEETCNCLFGECTLILLAAPKAVDYYEKIDMNRHPAAFTARASEMTRKSN